MSMNDHKAKIGRNAPCPCGSGKKYKHCCQGKPLSDSATTAPILDSAQDAPSLRPNPHQLPDQFPDQLPDQRPDQTASAWPDDAALTGQAEDLIAMVVRWRAKPSQELRWSAEVQHRLQNSHVLAFPLLRLLLTRYAPDGRQVPLPPEYGACLSLFEEALTQIRFSVERSRPAAIAMAEALQTEIAERGFRPEVQVGVQQDLVLALQTAKLPLHPRIREQAAAVADHYGRFRAGKGAPELDDLLARLIKETKPADAFDLLEPILAQMALIPAGGQMMLATGLLTSSQPLCHELAVLMLLHPDTELRIALPELYLSPECLRNLTGTGLRRLIGLRNWLPDAERPAIDALIRAARAAGTETKPLPPTELLGVLASPFDGAGSQAAWASIKSRKRYRVEGLLVKQSIGIREAFSHAEMRKHEHDGLLRQLTDAAGALPVDAPYLRRAIGHFLAVGLEQGTPAPPQLLASNERVGGSWWLPERVEPDAEIERLEPAFRADMDPELEPEILRMSGDWPSTLAFASSWFEDDVRVDNLLRDRIGNPDRWLASMSKAASLIMDQILEPKRGLWTERLLWMALMCKACRHSRPPLPWPVFLVLAKALQQGTALARIPLMRAVAERSVHSALQRSLRR
jgi:hypothetical protein